MDGESPRKRKTSLLCRPAACVFGLNGRRGGNGRGFALDRRHAAGRGKRLSAGSTRRSPRAKSKLAGWRYPGSGRTGSVACH